MNEVVCLRQDSFRGELDQSVEGPEAKDDRDEQEGLDRIGIRGERRGWLSTYILAQHPATQHTP